MKETIKKILEQVVQESNVSFDEVVKEMQYAIDRVWNSQNEKAIKTIPKWETNNG